MSQGETETILHELRLHIMSFSNELKAISDKYETDDGLSKEELENGEKRLEPLLNELVNKTNTCVFALEGSGEDRGDLIEDMNVHLELIEQKRQRFLVLKAEIKRKLSGMD